ncbi:MAG: hypothetical protein QME51_11690 [Planctomycetota bacterium]|nr:hypothetical protein [Planctomycetota bacterium]
MKKYFCQPFNWFLTNPLLYKELPLTGRASLEAVPSGIRIMPLNFEGAFPPEADPPLAGNYS